MKTFKHRKKTEDSQKNPEVAENLGVVTKLLHGIHRTGLTWKDQNLGRKVEGIQMN